MFYNGCRVEVLAKCSVSNHPMIVVKVVEVYREGYDMQIGTVHVVSNVHMLCTDIYKLGDRVVTPDGEAMVCGFNMAFNSVFTFSGSTVREFGKDELHLKSPKSLKDRLKEVSDLIDKLIEEINND